MKRFVISALLFLCPTFVFSQGISLGEFFNRAKPNMTAAAFKLEFKDLIKYKQHSEVAGETIDIALGVMSSIIPSYEGAYEGMEDSVALFIPLDLDFGDPVYLEPTFTEDHELMSCTFYLPPSSTNMQASVVMQRFTNSVSPYVDEVISEQAMPLSFTIGYGEEWTVTFLQFVEDTKQSSIGVIIPSDLMETLLDGVLERPTEKGYIRNSQWGDSRAEVERKEGKPDMFEKYGIRNDYYSYEGSIAGYDCTISFNFTYDDQLCGVGYFFDLSDDLYINAYKRIKQMLVEKYGEPISSAIDKANDYTRETALNIKLGHLSYQSIWLTSDNVGLVLRLNGLDSKISFSLLYYDVELMRHDENHTLNEL